MSDYRKTKLYDSHQSLKAKLVPFSDLDASPIFKIIKNIIMCSKCGLFDVSHMGEFIVSEIMLNFFTECNYQ